MSEIENKPIDEEIDLEEIEGICKSALVAVLAEAPWETEKANALSSTVIEHVLKALSQLGKPFKYVVTVVLQQRNGAGMYAAAGGKWDGKKDGTVKVPWESQTVQALVTVFAAALSPSPQQGT